MAAAIASLPSLDCELITDFARLETLAPEWNDLWRKSSHSEVFQHFCWMRAAWRTYGEELSLFTPAVYRGDQLVGILPVALRDGTLEFLASPLSDYNDVICADECAVEVITAALESLLLAKKYWKTCVLENVPAHSRIARYLPFLPASVKRHIQSAFRCPCSTILLGSDGNAIQKLISKKSLRRHENSLKREGQISFQFIEDRESIERHLGSFFNQHVGRRAVLGDVSHFLNTRTRTMFEILAEEFDPRNMLRFAVLSVDARPVAYAWGFEVDGKYLLYQTAFNIDYSRSGPSDVLLRQLFRYAQDHKLSEFDFSRGGETYKDRFATHVRENLTLYFNHDSGPFRLALVGIQRVDGVLRKKLETLRKYPKVYGFARQNAVRALTFFRKEKRSMKDGVLTYAVDRFRRFFANCIFSLDATATFPINKEEIEAYAGSLDVGLTLRLTTLSELAIIAVKNSGTIPSFSEFQSRLEAGQQAYIVWQGADPMQIWCMTSPNTFKEGGEFSSQRSALILDHCWSSPLFLGGGLRGVLQEVRGRDVDVLVSCRESDPVAQELRKLRLGPPDRALRFRLLHWLRPVLVLRDGVPRSISVGGA